MKASGQREEDLAKMKFSPELIRTVKQARRDKIANKTQEKERERRGEILNKTRKRMSQGLPAHLIATRGPRGVSLDKTIKQPSEGGYAGMIKRRAGMRLKNDSQAREEDISEAGRRLEAQIREENRLRRPAPPS